jgi:hypothetical protein
MMNQECCIKIVEEEGLRGGLVYETEDGTYFNLLGVQANLTSNLARGHRRIKNPKSRIIVDLSNHRGIG